MRVFSEGPNGEDKQLIGRCDRYSGMVSAEGELYLTNWVPLSKDNPLSQRTFGSTQEVQMLLGTLATLVDRLGGGVVIDPFEAMKMGDMAQKLVISQMRDPFAIKLVVLEELNDQSHL